MNLLRMIVQHVASEKHSLHHQAQRRCISTVMQERVFKVMARIVKHSAGGGWTCARAMEGLLYHSGPGESRTCQTRPEDGRRRSDRTSPDEQG